MNQTYQQQGAAPPEQYVSEPSDIALRDYFAAHAMQAWLSRVSFPNHSDGRVAAEYAYVVADAMLAARDK